MAEEGERRSRAPRREVPQQVGGPEELREPALARAVGRAVRRSCSSFWSTTRSAQTSRSRYCSNRLRRSCARRSSAACVPVETSTSSQSTSWPRSRRPRRYRRKQTQCPPPCGYLASAPASRSRRRDIRAAPAIIGVETSSVGVGGLSEQHDADLHARVLLRPF